MELLESRYKKDLKEILLKLDTKKEWEYDDVDDLGL